MLDAEGRAKIIDFGLATKYLSDEYAVMTDRVGTLYSMAPQVLQGDYDYKCDLWSIGVITYMLLSGHQPFWGPVRPMPWSKRRKIMIDRIRKGQYMRMTGECWSNVSKEAKDFVASLLQMDPNARPTAEEALQSPWMKLHPAETGLEAQQDPAMKQQQRLKRVAKKKLAQELTFDEISGLRKVFESYDTTGENIISLQDFRQALIDETPISKEDIATFVGQEGEPALDWNAGTEYLDFIVQVLEEKQKVTLSEVAHDLDEQDVEGVRQVPRDQVVAILEDKQVPAETIDIILKSIGEGQVASTVQVLELLSKNQAKRLRDSVRSVDDDDGDDFNA